MGLPIGGLRLTRPANLPPDGRITIPVRQDLTDYGNPGVHLGGPWAKPQKPKSQALGITRPGEALDLPAGGLLDCFPLGGDIMAEERELAAGEVRVFASLRLPYAFIITNIVLLSNSLIINDVQFRLKVADDDSTTGGLDTTGQDLFGQRAGSNNITFGDAVQHFSPNILVREPNKFLKSILRNLDVAIREVNYFVSWAYVPS